MFRFGDEQENTAKLFPSEQYLLKDTGRVSLEICKIVGFCHWYQFTEQTCLDWLCFDLQESLYLTLEISNKYLLNNKEKNLVKPQRLDSYCHPVAAMIFISNVFIL